MLVLAIETSTQRGSVALADDRGPVASATLGVPRRHGEFVAPAIRFLLEQSGRTVDDVTAVAVGIGPGLFTGLRVGLATASAFASARRLPTVGISGLDVLAFTHRHTNRLIAATVDARRGEVFCALYRPTPGGVERVRDPEVLTPEELGGELEAMADTVLVVGDGVPAVSRSVETSARLHFGSTSVPDAAALADLAVPRVQREETTPPHELAPLYLRQADAQIGWAERGSLGGGTA